MSFISLFVLILQSSPALTDPYTLRAIFRSDILSVFVSCIVVTQVFDPSVSMGRIKVLCSFTLVLRDRNFDLKKFNKVLEGNMVTLRKTDFFHLQIAGKVGIYHGCCLDRSFVCIKKKNH